ncbi:MULTISPECIES: class I SAM-dependent methyltransferase [Asticcacaulis]|uniref:class I SAM-dependent methyltransferase n=1 Tax=Asticcacaulis TaxID=76890 RepID=UPI001AE265DB|nr:MULTISPECIES: class I SAM-dependent methyltransferase [Asticcacaulis]MBP2159535.1 16S rRNA (guanine1207-N2)-methyltransferase [Asticcacaulis solisilvae]MDR6800638.1 16S rRNA (guanine1207-N2)-methyltransferase [Asticcacaulis sp. BE141]
MNDPIYETLVLPIEDGTVALPDDGALFLRARTGFPSLPTAQVLCEQSFRPAYDALIRSGFTLRDTNDGRAFGLTLVLPQRQRDENRALLARAVMSTRDGGIVMAAQSNTQGAKTFENELEALAGNVTSLSKNKCRVFWARIDQSQVDSDLLEAWLANDAPHRNDAGYLSRPGLFAWDRIDAGSQKLIDHLPADLSGRAADLGAGFGYLADAALKRCPKLTHIDLYEAEQRALDLARENLAEYGDRAQFLWADVTRGVTGDYDVIISNPPFHVDREDRSDIGQAFIRAAAGALKSGGQLFMVANRHLPYEDTLKAAFKSVKMLADTGGYKIIQAIGPQAKRK